MGLTEYLRIRYQEEGELLEYIVILGGLEISNLSGSYWDTSKSKLFESYRTTIKDSHSSSEFDKTSDSQIKLLRHVGEVHNLVEQGIYFIHTRNTDGVGFLQSVKQLDLVTSTFASE